MLTPSFGDTISPRIRTSSMSKPSKSPGHALPLPGVTESSALTEVAGSPPRRQQRAGIDSIRPPSPDIGTILATTPRPRRRSSAAFAPSSFRVRSRTSSVTSVPSSWQGNVDEAATSSPLGGLMDDGGLKEVDSDIDSQSGKELEGDGSESDSSIDLHTPLPHLMFRDGLLSPRSKLLPHGPGSAYSLDNDDIVNDLDRSRSVLSVASTAGSVMTKSGLLYKDPRDTARRRLRHRDGHLLRAGMGLTTGLGWSDSEDEDAPSMLTRRLIHTSIARRPSTSLPRPLSEIGPSSVDSVDSSPSQSPPPTKSSFRMGPSGALHRSASTSLSNLRRPSMTESGALGNASLTRNRTASSASITSASTTSSTAVSSTLSSTNPGGVQAFRRIVRLPKPADVQSIISRHKPKSSASASTSSIASIQNAALSTPLAPQSSGLRVPAYPLRTAKSSEIPGGVRNRTVSTASSTSTVSMHSHTSGSSTSTASASNATTTAANMRPLRLPQSASIRRPAGRAPSGPAPRIVSKKGISLDGQRARALSTSQVFASPYTTGAAQARSFSPSTLSSPTSYGGKLASPPLSPVPSPPPSSPRVRPLVPGPRPKPRTGTGMTYRTSSYASLQAEAIRMRSVSVSSSSVGVSNMF